jgi:hypothetical protein
MHRPAVSLCLLAAAMAHVLAIPPNITQGLLTHEPPTVNISFIKEVTLTIQPQDFELTPHDEEEVASFLQSSLHLLDPIMRFFDGFVSGWMSPPPQPARPSDPRLLHIA